MNVTVYSPEQLPEVNRREVFRYAGTRQPSRAEEALLDECLPALLPSLTYRVAWDKYPVTADGACLNLGFTVTRSADLARALKNCSHILLFAATVGFAPDRMAQRYSKISPVRALLLQSLGNERIEALCDRFCAGFPGARPRFSPGYGDFSLTHQRDILAVLDCPRKIGLTLTDSLLLSPTKSVTAVMGIE